MALMTKEIKPRIGTEIRAEWDDPTCGRMMHRTKLEGEEAFAYA